MKTTIQKLITRDKIHGIHIKISPWGIGKDGILRVENVLPEIVNYSNKIITRPVEKSENGHRYDIFRIPYKKEKFDTDQEIIDMVTTTMNKAGYRPATFDDLVSYLILNPEYVPYDEKDLVEIRHREIVALGSVGKTDGISWVPAYCIHTETYGSSLDQDLGHYHYPELKLLWFRETRNPMHYRLGYYHYSFLGVLNE